MKFRLLFLLLLFMQEGPGATFTVTTVADEFDTPSGATLSLREALRDTAANAGLDTIVFNGTLSGTTITLDSAKGQIAITDTPGGVIIDATSLPGGLTIDAGSGTNRVFTVNSGRSVTLIGLTMTGGNGTGGSNSGAAGAIDNFGTLVLTRCSLTVNTAIGAGGAIRNNAGSTLTLNQCTLSGNTGDFGGGISNLGTLTLTGCTLANNIGLTASGAIDNNPSSSLTLAHCTISGNSAGSGGGIDNLGALTLNNSIVAGNTLTAGSSGPDIFNEPGATLTRLGVNLVPTAVAGTVNGSGVINADNPLLAPFSNYGGPTKTMALLPGSPALDTAALIVPALDLDQRGFPRNRDGNAIAGAQPDIGAYEAQAMPFSAGFNFVGGGPAGSAGTLADADRAGGPGVAQVNWNNLISDADGSGNGAATNAATKRDATGASLAALKLWWDAPNTWGFTSAGLTTPDRKLMGGYLDSDGSGDGSLAANLYAGTTAQPFFGISGLPVTATLGGYKVVVYADGDTTDGRIAKYWLTTNRAQNPATVGGERLIAGPIFNRDTANFSGTYAQATATVDAGAATPGGNYLVFENLAEPGGFYVRAEEGSLPIGTSGRAPINAVQVVRNEIIVVTTTADENDPNGTPGAGLSLRGALRDAPEGAGIIFDASLNGAVITLGSQLALTKNVTVDAGSLAAGLTIHEGPGTNRIFTVNSGKTAALISLTLTGGDGTGGSVTVAGGAIDNFGKLQLLRCTLSGNTATGSGGAVRNANSTAILALHQCTLSNNTAGFGGAISNLGTTTLTHCTLSANAASSGGGAIDNNQGSILTLLHCTVAGNSAGSGGGLDNLGTLTLTDSIVGPNSLAGAGSGTDIFNEAGASFTIAGNNLVQTAIAGTGGVTIAGSIGIAATLLAPLGNYGGPTSTQALLPGSPARNAAASSTATVDQRGLPIIGIPDIGAYEAGTFSNYNAWIYESLPVAATGPQHAAAFDYDGDGASNTNEWAALTNPASAASVFRITSAVKSGGNVTITFPSVTGKTYTLWQSDTLTGAWTNTGQPAITGSDSAKTFTVPAPVNGVPRRFHRVQVGP